MVPSASGSAPVVESFEQVHLTASARLTRQIAAEPAKSSLVLRPSFFVRPSSFVPGPRPSSFANVHRSSSFVHVHVLRPNRPSLVGRFTTTADQGPRPDGTRPGEGPTPDEGRSTKDEGLESEYYSGIPPAMPSLHERAKEVFLDALDCPAPRRPAFVADACAGDELLRREVESLLEFHEEEGDRHSEGTGTSLDAPSDEEVDPFIPGHVFAGRYRMITRIGRGGMGDVWRADDLVLETPVALKLLFSTGAEARQRILNEVRLARRITHPAVCRVFDVGEAEGRVFFSMELVHGEDLATVLKRAGRLPSEKVIEIAHQLSAGLHAAHIQRVLHRDLKPGNVLIDENGHVRITDFGIAVTRTEGARHTLIGTPGYMAPEQMRADADLSERTDIYALGVVLYELVAGQHPFKGSRPSTAPPKP